MATKVYWKSLRLVLGVVKRYIQKWDEQLQTTLTEEQWACVQATLNAVLTCLAILPTNEPE